MKKTTEFLQILEQTFDNFLQEFPENKENRAVEELGWEFYNGCSFFAKAIEGLKEEKINCELVEELLRRAHNIKSDSVDLTQFVLDHQEIEDDFMQVAKAAYNLLMKFVQKLTKAAKILEKKYDIFLENERKNAQVAKELEAAAGNLVSAAFDFDFLVSEEA